MACLAERALLFVAGPLIDLMVGPLFGAAFGFVLGRARLTDLRAMP